MSYPARAEGLVNMYNSKGPKFAVSVCERDMYEETRTQADGRTAYWPFLNLRCDSISRDLRLYFFDGGLSTAVYRMPPVPRLRTHACRFSKLLTARISSAWPTVTERFVMYKLFHNAQLFLPVRDSQDLFVPTHCLFSGNQFVYTGVFCVENANRRLCQWSICDKMTIQLMWLLISEHKINLD